MQPTGDNRWVRNDPSSVQGTEAGKTQKGKEANKPSSLKRSDREKKLPTDGEEKVVSARNGSTIGNAFKKIGEKFKKATSSEPKAPRNKRTLEKWGPTWGPSPNQTEENPYKGLSGKELEDIGEIQKDQWDKRGY